MLCLNVLPCNHSQVVLFFPFGTTKYKSDCIPQKSSSDILLVPNRHLQHFMLFGGFFFFFLHMQMGQNLLFSCPVLSKPLATGGY